MRYANLIAEMARKKITRQSIATLLEITINTVSTKINGKYPFAAPAGNIVGYCYKKNAWAD